MKKLLSMLLAITLVFSLLSMAALADDATGMISITSAEGVAGESVTVTVSLDSNPGVAFLGISITYDSTKLEAPTITGTGLTGWVIMNTAVWFSPVDSTYTGDILTLTFAIKTGVTGTATVSVDQLEAWNTSGQAVVFNVNPGTITIEDDTPPTEKYAITVDSGIENGSVIAQIGGETADKAAKDEIVTLTATPAKGYTLDTLTVRMGEETIETTQDDNDPTKYTFPMPEGDVTVTANFILEKEPEFKVQSLLLSGQIGVNFFMDLPEIEGADYSNSYMEFTVNGKTTTAKFDELFRDQSDNGYYGFSCYVNSIQMAEPITAKYHYSLNGADATVTKTYSVRDYIIAFDEAVESKADMFDDTTKALVRALADYGHYEQLFLSDVNTWIIGEDYAEMDVYYTGRSGSAGYSITDVESAVSPYAISKKNNSGDIEKITYSLTLDSGTAINVYFKMKEQNYSGSFTVTVNGKSASAEKLADGRYRVTIPGISAHLLGNKYTIDAQTANGSATVDVSALSYVNGLLKAYQDNSTYQNAAAALYYYWAAAENYSKNH